ncbi:MAG: hypothetical protein V1789_08770 [PVC group bacterium]
MGIVWIFIVAIVAIIVVYLIANRSCSCGAATDGTPGPGESGAEKEERTN